jgi:hypothetical protein
MAPIAKDVTFEVVGQNDDGTYTVRAVGGGGNPYAGGGSSPNLPAVTGGGYVALLNGRRVTFASEADAEVAGMAISELRGGGAGLRELNSGWSRSSGPSSGGSSSGARFLRGGADIADTVTAFFRARNLYQKRDELCRAITASNAARDKISGLSSRYPDLIPGVIDYMQAEREVHASAVGILDDQILGVDVQAGTGVARVMADMWDGMAREGYGSGGDGFSALAAGGVGLGIGLLLSSRGRRERNV